MRRGLGDPAETEGTGRPSGQFVGRDLEIATLVEALDRSPPHATTAWLLTGAAGIGKTRLSRELTQRAEAKGWRTVWAHGWAGAGVPPYWPWTQALRALLDRPSTELASLLDGAPSGDQFELFDATARRLDEMADGPLLIVLDDLHVADADSLHLLRFLTSHGASAPRVVLGSWRLAPGEKVDPEALGLTGHLHLDGLSVEATRSLLDGAEGVDEIHRLTGGNPLFLAQVATASPSAAPRTAARESATDPLMQVTERRLAELPAEVAELLLGVAVLGPHATVPALAALLDRRDPAVRDAIERAAAAGVVEGGSPVRMAHPLFAEAAVARASRRCVEELHAFAADLLDSDLHPSAVATHLANAGPDRHRCAVQVLLKAARDASADFAHELAVEHLRQADELLHSVRLEVADPATGEEAMRLHWEVVFALAAAVRSAEGRAAAEPIHDRAEALAVATGDPLIMARSVVRHGIEYFTTGEQVRARAERCRETLALLPPGDSALRVALLAQIAVGGMAGIDVMANRRTATDAVAMARRIGDPVALATALVADQVVELGPASLSHRLATGRELLELVEGQDVSLAIHARFLLKAALLEAGEVRELDSHINLQLQQINRVSEARWARHGLWFRCMQAMLDGDPARVEELAGEIGLIADRLEDPDGVGVFFGQLGIARWMQGRLAEMEDAYRSQLRDEPQEPLWPSVLAWVALHDGRRDDARGWVERCADPAAVPESMHTLLTLTTMADVLAEVGDDQQVAAIRAALSPYADRVVPVAMGAGLFGPVARCLAALAVRLGEREEAISLYRQAIAVAGRLGARPWVCEAQVGLAELLVDGTATDRARAALLVREAAAIRRTGTVVFERRLVALEQRLASAGVDGTATHAARPSARIVLLGNFEVAGLDGTVARWTSRKARTLLKLLAAAGGGFVARDRVLAELWPDTDPDVLGNRLAVALTTVRRALDPQRTLDISLVAVSDDGIRLVTDHPLADVVVDAHEFLAAARGARMEDAALGRGTEVQQALALFTGLPFAEETYAAWATSLREEVLVAAVGLLGRAVELARAAGDHLEVAALTARLLELEPFDEAAHTARIAAFEALGAHTQADRARDALRTARSELGLPANPH